MAIYEPTNQEIESFGLGMLKVSELIKKLDPNTIIFPLRGAYPFYLTCKRIADMEARPFKPSLFLPTGTFVDLSEKSKGGLTKPEKQEVINKNLALHIGTNRNNQSYLLIDEVLNGGTIMTHYGMISNFLNENGLNFRLDVCAVEDKRIKRRNRYGARKAKQGFHIVGVDNLFTTDREKYLPCVYKEGEDFRFEFDDTKFSEVLDRLEDVVLRELVGAVV